MVLVVVLIDVVIMMDVVVDVVVEVVVDVMVEVVVVVAGSGGELGMALEVEEVVGVLGQEEAGNVEEEQVGTEAERVEGEKLALETGGEEQHGEVGLVGRVGVDEELVIELVLA